MKTERRVFMPESPLTQDEMDRDHHLRMRIKQFEDSKLNNLLVKMPQLIKEAIQGRIDDLQEIKIALGCPAQVLFRDGTVTLEDVILDKDEFKTLSTKFGEPRHDGRIGIDGTLHRVSVTRSTSGVVRGFSIRFGRHVIGAADALRDYLQSGQSGIIIGGPGRGKTTILREAARLSASSASAQGFQTVVVDKSNEIGGEGDIAHIALRSAWIKQVPRGQTNAEVMMEGLTNDNPRLMIADEVGDEEDARSAKTVIRRAVPIICTVHGDTLEEVMDNEDISLLMGRIDLSKRKRFTQPLFQYAIEVVKTGQFVVHPNVRESIDRILENEVPHTIKRGIWDIEVEDVQPVR
ncbi:hypothetical protein [Deinococcus roseus]|uniref:AAA+ ATPase domain-containing protein n=1 Tax=Deinococcus roseus TaxID=392414 RepID=A0ABQ2D6U6_9DEIO|nr:hypothetical protein [Deinococcus roseus]GGJ48230.1 hypothetical protein GCM10008938_37800 [Deinococcus roseus]